MEKYVRIPHSEIPQADVLHDVFRVAEAVKNGERTFQDIAKYIGKVERQGRYYRLAAEILGLITNHANYAELTQFGTEVVNASRKEQKSLLLKAVLNTKFFRRMVPFFELHPEGVTRSELEGLLTSVTEPVGLTMMHRRVSTIVSWLETLGLLKKLGDKYRLSREIPEEVPLLEFADIEPILPKSGDLKEYKAVTERLNIASRTIEVMRDQAKIDRANEIHKFLVNLVASRLRSAGALPRCNQFIDLAAQVNNRPYIFEMKSISPNNARGQLRRGLSQLYEYRYLQDLPEATLVLVIQKQLPKGISWMQDYMEKDRGVQLLWNGTNELYSTPETRQNLSFLWKA